MKTEIEIFNSDNTRKVIITRSRDFSSMNPKAFDYYLTPLFFQPFLNLGWCLTDYKQTISIHSLSDAKMIAKDYLYNEVV